MMALIVRWYRSEGLQDHARWVESDCGMTHDDDHDRGLAFDLQTLTRGRMFGWMAGATAGLALVPVLAGCGTSDDASDVDAAGGSDGGGGTCTAIPEETAGPYPGDGSNGANALAISGIVRSDIRSSFGTASG